VAVSVRALTQVSVDVVLVKNFVVIQTIEVKAGLTS
jgi:hypothetical protein